MEKKRLHLVTCGNVDDGKSTLIGRLLWETHQIADDQLASLEKDSQRYGTQGKDIDYALLLDGLLAEREQGITIDIAYRTLDTPRHRFLLADSPGHEEYTRNMFTAASDADIGIVLVDSQKTMMEQTYRHLRVLSMLRVPHLIIVLNKMDTVQYSEAVFQEKKVQLEQCIAGLSFQQVAYIPMSALKGDHMTGYSQHMPWYRGKSFLEELEAHSPVQNDVFSHTLFPVQWVQRDSERFRGYAGTLLTGTIHKGDTFVVYPSQQSVTVDHLFYRGQSVEQASAKQAIMLELKEPIDLQRGSILASDPTAVQMDSSFTASVMWMSKNEGRVGQSFIYHMAGKNSRMTIARIHYQLELSTGVQQTQQVLRMNSVCQIELRSAVDIPWLPYEKCKALGSGILIDAVSHETVAAVVLEHSHARSQVVSMDMISTEQRTLHYGHLPLVIWLTGLPAAGKTTLAHLLERKLVEKQYHCMVLDADILRQHLSSDLGFTEADRKENNRRITELAKLLADRGLVVIVACIAPYAADRAWMKQYIGRERVLEVFVDTPLSVCEQRDPKGLYKRARQGLLKQMTGIDSVYEAPEHPDIRVQDSTLEIDAIWKIIQDKIQYHPSSSTSL